MIGCCRPVSSTPTSTSTIPVAPNGGLRQRHPRGRRGVTTIVDMPLNSLPPTVDVAALETKRAVAEPKAFVDVGFWGGAISATPRICGPARGRRLRVQMLPRDSGVEEFPPLEPAGDDSGYGRDRLLRRNAHRPRRGSRGDDLGTEELGTEVRRLPPPAPRGENVAIGRVIDAARETGARAHILHLSSADSLGQIAAAKAEGIKLTVETCPHYLVFSAEEIPDGATTHKCCPPIREESNREALWQGLIDGTIDCIVSDHSPSTAELKLLDTGDVGAAWGGISSLQLGLSLVWTEAAKRGIELAEVVRWMSAAPAAVARVADKGAIVAGNDADFAVFAPTRSGRCGHGALAPQPDQRVRHPHRPRSGHADVLRGTDRLSRPRRPPPPPLTTLAT